MNGYSHNHTSTFRQLSSGVKALKNFHLSDLRKVFSLMGKVEKILLLALSLAALLSLTLSARGFYLRHTHSVPALGGQLTEGVLGQPQYINPLLAITDTDQSLTHLVFAGLYKYDAGGQLIPDLADGMPQISDDQKNYTIKLKTNAFWHNHRPLNADDVVFTIQTLKNPDFKSPLRAFWQNTAVEKSGDYEIKFTTKDIVGPFIHNLTLPILPKNLWQGVDSSSFLLSKNNLEAIGSGPYAISQINKLPSGKIQSIALKSFAQYHNSPANIETWVFKFYDTEDDLLNGLRGHEIDLAGTVPALGEKTEDLQQKFRVLRLPIPQYQMVFFNLADGLTGQEPIRRALALGTNREKLLADIFGSIRLIPTNPLSGQVDGGSYDLGQARKILDQAGWITGNDNLRHKKDLTLALTVTTSDSPQNAQTAKALQTQWQALNIQVNLDIKPAKQLMDETIRGRKYQALIYSQKFGADPDPFFFWHSSQSKDPGLNLTGLSDNGLDQLLTDARNTTNPEKRQEKYTALAQTIGTKTPTIILNQSQYFYFVAPNIQNINLKSLNDNPSRFYDIPYWYAQTKRVWQ